MNLRLPKQAANGHPQCRNPRMSLVGSVGEDLTTFEIGETVSVRRHQHERSLRTEKTSGDA
jgi:hypothetical protein